MKFINSFLKLKTGGYKGQNGTILILGGSKLYTGAPIFAAKGALRSGSELVYVMTHKEAVPTIKCLQEAIVSEFLFESRILDKITCCILGPGLGRVDEDTLSLIFTIVKYLDKKEIPFVIDADGIHYYKTGILINLKNVILTPNHKEAVGLNVSKGHYCIYKGKEDVIAVEATRHKITDKSSLKRCGGQGDILTGILATAISIDPSSTLNACISSCKLLRASSSHSFEKNGFSMITSDIFKGIKKSLKNLR